METRANFILIGLFTLCGILGAFGFFIWLAKIEVDRQYAYYDVLFESVSGLDRAADVQFSGLSVGKVISLDLFADDPAKVIVRIEVAAETPIKTDTKAQLQSQGVTGVAYVSLTGGSSATPYLRDEERTTVVPVIEAQRSVVQALTADAPDLLAEAVNLLLRLEQLVSDENMAHVASMLANLDQTTQLLPSLAARSDSTLTAAVHTVESIDAALLRLESSLEAGEATLNAGTKTFNNLNTILKQNAGPAIADLQAAATQFETGLPQYVRLAREARDLVKSLQQLTARMERDPARFFFGNNVPELRR